MKKIVFVVVFALFSALYAGYDVGNIAVVQGGPNIASGLIGALEQVAGQEFYKTHSDIYDFLVVFTTFTPSMNMQQGLAIQGTVTGIGRDGSYQPYGPASKWGSAGKLIGGTRMCHIDQYPDDPDAVISTNPISPFAGESTVELLAHEFSHYWLMALEFKKEGMTQNHTGLRGWESDAANQHWNSYASSGPSVEYGQHYVDNGDGTFTMYPAQPRKYGPFDQYALGLTSPEETPSVFFLCSSSDIMQCTQGSPAVPAAKGGSNNKVSGMYKHEVAIADVIRAMGPRKPASADAPKHWNVAFVIINQPGVDPFPNQIARLDALRIRFQEWFSWATDGRASICTELSGDCSGAPVNDGDIVNSDADSFIDAEPDEVVTADETADNDGPVSDNSLKSDADIAVADNSTIQDTNISQDNTAMEDSDTAETDSSGCGCAILF